MDRDKLDTLAVFLSGYAKRLLETQYDLFAKSSVGKAVQGLDSRIKYAIEAALYAAMTFAHFRFPDNTPIRLLAKEILLDLPPELAKRIMNGGILGPESNAADGADILANRPSEGESLADLAEELATQSDAGRRSVIAQLHARATEILSSAPVASAGTTVADAAPTPAPTSRVGCILMHQWEW